MRQPTIIEKCRSVALRLGLMVFALGMMRCSTYPKIVVPAYFDANTPDPNTQQTYWSEIFLDQTNQERPIGVIVGK